MLRIKRYVLTTCCKQTHDEISHYSASLEQHLRSKIDARCKMMRVFPAIKADQCVWVFYGAELTGTPKWPRLRRKPRAGAGTVAAGCRMDRESLGFIWSNSGSKDCAVPCSSITDALKRKNRLLIKQTLFKLSFIVNYSSLTNMNNCNCKSKKYINSLTS